MQRSGLPHEARLDILAIEFERALQMAVRMAAEGGDLRHTAGLFRC